MEDTSKWINTINRERVQERKIHISFLYRLSRVFPCTIWGNLELTWNAGSTLFPSKALGRSVVFPFRYAHGKEGREPLAGSGRIFSVFRARKCHFPCFPGRSFINQSMKKLWRSSQHFSGCTTYRYSYGFEFNLELICTSEGFSKSWNCTSRFGECNFAYWKTRKCKLIPNWTRKTVWLLINNINVKNFAWRMFWTLQTPNLPLARA